jgi:hypothetical protein
MIHTYTWGTIAIIPVVGISEFNQVLILDRKKRHYVADL